MNMIFLKLGLQDIELPPPGMPSWLVALFILLGCILLLCVFLLWRKRQNPLNRARRLLQALSTSSPDPDEIAKILRQGLQVRRLKQACLPEDFIRRLDQARFSPAACDAKTFKALKTQALQLLLDASSTPEHSA